MKEKFTIDRLLSEYGGLLQKYCGHDSETLKKGYQPSQEDHDSLTAYLKALFHECLGCNEGLSKVEILEKNRQVYLAMARFARDYHSEDPNPYIRMAFESEFQYWSVKESKGEIGIMARIHAEKDSCGFGKVLDQKCLALREMQRSHPLASDVCSRSEGCVCSYRFSPVKEMNPSQAE